MKSNIREILQIDDSISHDPGEGTPIQYPHRNKRRMIIQLIQGIKLRFLISYLLKITVNILKSISKTLLGSYIFRKQK